MGWRYWAGIIGMDGWGGGVWSEGAVRRLLVEGVLLRELKVRVRVLVDDWL